MSVENDEKPLDETVYWFMLQPRMADPEAVSILAKEVLDLRDRVRELEDQLRWRKWPEEWPNRNGRYLVAMDSSDPIDDGKWLGCCNYQDCQWFGQTWGVGQLYFKAIGPLP